MNLQARVNQHDRRRVIDLRVPEGLPRPVLEHQPGEEKMNKLLSVMVAAIFAASTSAFVASPAGAQAKDEKAKMEKKKGEGKKKAEGAKKPAGEKKPAPKKSSEPKKTQKKGEGKKKDEMKK
jgi:hypothetical protein